MNNDYMKCGCVTIKNEITILSLCEEHEWMLCAEWELIDEQENDD